MKRIGMDIGRQIARWLKERNLIRVVPWRFLQCYVYPLTVRQKKRPYRPEKYFESYYSSVFPNDFSDAATIGPSIKRLHADYHYNALENSIISYFITHPIRPQPNVLDIGSGAGHWIDFYQESFGAVSVTGIEISKTCAEFLRNKYIASSQVRILTADITDEHFTDDESYDVINAIGVMFHIVDDALWQQALANLSKLLAKRTASSLWEACLA